jgi:TolB-like protein
LKKHFPNLFRNSLCILSGLLFLCTAATAYAAPVRVAILPFAIHAEKDLSFLQGGIIEMLGSRISYKDQVEVIGKDETRSVLKSIEGLEGKSRALGVGGKLNADYVLFGSITMLGESVSIDAKMVDVSGKKAPLPLFAQTRGMDNIIDQITQLATTINETIFGRATLQRTKSVTSSIGDSAPSSRIQSATTVESGNNAEKVSRPMVPSTKGPLAQSAARSNPLPNPLLVAAPSAKGQNGGSAIWKSRSFNAVISAMDIGDVDNDGKLETILALDNTIEIYKVTQNRLVKIAAVKNTPKGNYIGLDVADINGNGRPEIIVSSVAFQRDRFNSFVLEFDGTEFKTILDRSPWLYRVSRPINGDPILVGQRRKSIKNEGDLFATPIYKMLWKGSKYMPNQKMVKKGIANVMGTAVDDVMNDGANQFLAYSPGDRLRIYDGFGKAVWEGKEKLGGSIASFAIPTKDPSVIDNIQYFPMRIRTADIDQDGNIEVIVAANHDMAGVMKTLRIFDRSSIISMSWNGFSLSKDWSTSDIEGRVADFIISDFDNDGHDEIVATVVLKEKATVGVKERSVIIAYELSFPKGKKGSIK